MKHELKEFGLTENESVIYLALLKEGSANPSVLADKTGFSRSYVYDALERLQEKEVVSSFSQKGKKHYQANNPEWLEEISKQRLQNIQRILPQLQRLYGDRQEEIKVELHKGTYAYKVLLNDIIVTLKKGGEVLIFGIDDGFLVSSDSHYVTYLRQYYARLKTLGITERAVVKEDAVLFKETPTTYRFLQKQVIGNTAFEVYGDKVAIFLWGTPHYLIFIHNKEVADSYRHQFDILWQASNNESRRCAFLH